MNAVQLPGPAVVGSNSYIVQEAAPVSLPALPVAAALLAFEIGARVPLSRVRVQGSAYVHDTSS